MTMSARHTTGQPTAGGEGLRAMGVVRAAAKEGFDART